MQERAEAFWNSNSYFLLFFPKGLQGHTWVKPLIGNLSGEWIQAKREVRKSPEVSSWPKVLLTISSLQLN